MFGDTYASLLEELSIAIGCSPLRPDENNVCKIQFPTGIAVQIEMDRQQAHLLIVAELGSLSPGKYREQVLTEALRTNDQPPPRFGNFAYNPSRDQLILWELIPVNNLKGSDIAQLIVPLVNKATACQRSVASNMLPAISITGGAVSSAPRGIFGLR